MKTMNRLIRDEIVYFELNNWSSEYYPKIEPFLSWMGDDLNLKFRDEKFVKENKLCVVISILDMSQNFCITATKSWVEDNCPIILLSDFLRIPGEDGCVYGRFNCSFLEYREDNIGIKWELD